LSTSPSKLGRQSCRVACLSVCVSVADLSNNSITSATARDNDDGNDSWRQELQRQLKMDDEKRRLRRNLFHCGMTLEEKGKEESPS
jgi:hypothetical protein